MRCIYDIINQTANTGPHYRRNYEQESCVYHRSFRLDGQPSAQERHGDRQVQEHHPAQRQAFQPKARGKTSKEVRRRPRSRHGRPRQRSELRVLRRPQRLCHPLRRRHPAQVGPQSQVRKEGELRRHLQADRRHPQFQEGERDQVRSHRYDRGVRQQRLETPLGPRRRSAHAERL